MSDEKNEFDVFDDLIEEEELSQKSYEDELPQKSQIPQIFFEKEKINQFRKNLTNLEKSTQPHIKTTKLEKNCSLETIVRNDLKIDDFELDIEKPIINPEKKYAFKLDPFQKAAVLSIENNTSVLVAAHTSAGKTAVAEYVIAKCLNNNQRVIYTSPIKALSNQKYRDLKEEFGQVGLVTGDITIDENQTCLVMTTEILRNMFFRSNEVAKETAWIIFDEAHYLKDKDRGVIWEETIILAPKNVRYCLLSATAPNASELAQWILKVKGLDCINVIYTEFRPTPLENYAYMSGDKRILLMKDTKGKLYDKNYQKLSGDTSDTKKENKKGGKSQGSPKDILNIVKLINLKKFSPAIIFAFSKKEVENLAKNISKSLKMLTKKEEDHIESLYKTMISSLSKEDQNLPQIVSLVQILKSGVGLHHGGMLPILKEIVEILFQSGLIKILISTETFSMGVNMPAKCVVFSTLRKWDGESFRQLLGSEFVQMSGRAGRRNTDKKGIVITMLDKGTDVSKFWKMLKAQSTNDPLISQFSISYNMLINTLLMEGMKPEEMVKKSFKQFQHEIQSKKSEDILNRWERTLNYLDEQFFDKNKNKFLDCLKIIEANQKLEDNNQKINNILVEPTVILPFLNIGRLFFVEGCGWVPIINFNKKKDRIYGDFFILMNYSKKEGVRKNIKCSCFQCIRKYQYETLKEPKVISLDLDKIRKVSSIVVVLPTNLLNLQEKIILRDTVQNIILELKHNIPLMKLIEDLPIENHQLKTETELLLDSNDKIIEEIDELKRNYINDYFTDENLLKNNMFLFDDLEIIENFLKEEFETSKTYFETGDFSNFFLPLEIQKQKISKQKEYYYTQEIKNINLLCKFSQTIKNSLQKTENNSILVFTKKIESMKKILTRLEFINKEEVPTSKGKIASLIFGSDELLLTEVIFSGILRNLTPKQIDVIMSLFINEETMREGVPIKIKSEKLSNIFYEVKKILEFIVSVNIDAEMENYDSDEILNKLNPSMFDVIEKWYDGSTFMDICKKSKMYEGSIIRNIKRLYELLKQLAECSSILGNKELTQKIEEGSQRLYRGIVFTSSLYI